MAIGILGKNLSSYDRPAIPGYRVSSIEIIFTKIMPCLL